MADKVQINSTGLLCDALVAEVKAEETILLQGEFPEKQETDPFESVTDPLLLEKNKTALEGALDGVSGSAGDGVGANEENAFLTAFSNTYARGTQSRSKRFLAAHRRYLDSAETPGVLNKQLRGIGTKVDSNWITGIVNETEQ